MKPAQIVREAVVEYLKRHLPKDAKEKLLKNYIK
jgi:flagellar motor component MotA